MQLLGVARLNRYMKCCHRYNQSPLHLYNLSNTPPLQLHVSSPFLPFNIVVTYTYYD